MMNDKDYTPARRPLIARNWSVSGTACRVLAAWGVPPNAISVAGFLASFAAGVALYSSNGCDHERLLLVSACLLLLIRGACNMLDGMVAVSLGRASRGGELYNEVPDRLSDSVILIGAGYANGGVPELGYIAAIAAVFTAYVRVQCYSLGAAMDFGGPMAKIQRMFVVAAAALHTAFAPQSWQFSIVAYPEAGTFGLALVIIISGCAATSLRRLRVCSRALEHQP
jgi:phosphatidylglycerophosphate synthase